MANSEHAFRHTNLTAGCGIYARRRRLPQRPSANAVIHKDNNYAVSVHTKAGERVTFVAGFVALTIDNASGDAIKLTPRPRLEG